MDGLKSWEVVLYKVYKTWFETLSLCKRREIELNLLRHLQILKKKAIWWTCDEATHETSDYQWNDLHLLCCTRQISYNLWQPTWYRKSRLSSENLNVFLSVELLSVLSGEKVLSCRWQNKSVEGLSLENSKAKTQEMFKYLPHHLRSLKCMKWGFQRSSIEHGGLIQIQCFPYLEHLSRSEITFTL